MKLLWILLGLAVTLFIVIGIVEKYGKPLSVTRQNNLSKIVMFLVFGLLIIQIVLHWLKSE
ncbi:MAG: hypothetical protein QS748_11985 [Candidatus Endonucleobacter bathymodioli]|uniref:Uncharacterized protein n=1 Tax=Candidatus Endonucleibacter bathymodioli TaxID=539814 RepID=A0AA90SDY8_9GAMM|nr:hypothetical protein [Candidatus Endonucleobacter bathymodioli]